MMETLLFAQSCPSGFHYIEPEDGKIRARGSYAIIVLGNNFLRLRNLTFSFRKK